MSKAQKKTAKIAEKAEAKKAAVIAKEPSLDGGGPLAWRIGIMDHDGPFGWSQLTDAAKLREVISKLHEFEHKPWAEITKGGSHPIECSRLCKEAKDRLKKISQDDVEELMSFRLTGKNRVWCIRHLNVMRILWWDPDHKVYPTLVDRADRGPRASQR